MTEQRAFRHYCGELIYAEIFQSNGETIPAFFGKNDSQTVIRDCPGCGETLDLDYCGVPWLVEPMDDLMAQHTITTKFCSNCWGHGFRLLPAHDLKGNFIGTRVVCVECVEETVGYVSMNHITAAKADDRIYYMLDAKSICKALGLELPETVVHTEAENLHALGF